MVSLRGGAAEGSADCCHNVAKTISMSISTTRTTCHRTKLYPLLSILKGGINYTHLDLSTSCQSLTEKGSRIRIAGRSNRIALGSYTVLQVGPSVNLVYKPSSRASASHVLLFFSLHLYIPHRPSPLLSLYVYNNKNILCRCN